MSQARTRLSPGMLVYVAALFAALGGLLFGYNTGVISGALLFLRQRFALDATGEGIVVSSVLWGAVLGAAVAGSMADRWGRKPVIVGAAGLFVIGAVVTALSPSVLVLVAGRVVVGVAIGAASLIAPMYIAEIAPARIRGSLVTLNQLALTVGIVLSYLVNYLFAATGAWRWMFAVAVVPSVVLGVGAALLPESPRWLAKQGKQDHALDVLRRIAGPSSAPAELDAIGHRLRARSGGWRELLSPRVRPALQLAVLMALIQQITGINTVIYYAPTIFQMTGFRSASVSILATVGIGVVNVLATVLALFLLDRAGRRPLLLAGLAGMAVSLGLLGLAFYLQTPGLSGIAAASLGLYIASFAIGLGPVFWLLLPEIFPLEIRGLGMSVAIVANWGSNLLVTSTFPALVAWLGGAGTFWIYAALSVASWVYVLARVPETKGKSLEQIEEHLLRGQQPT